MLDSGDGRENLEAKDVEGLLEELKRGLHDMSQPLTTLQCRLYVGSLESDAAGLRKTVEDGVVDCERVMGWVHHLQNRLERLEMEMKGEGIWRRQ